MFAFFVKSKYIVIKCLYHKRLIYTDFILIEISWFTEIETEMSVIIDKLFPHQRRFSTGLYLRNMIRYCHILASATEGLKRCSFGFWHTYLGFYDFIYTDTGCLAVHVPYVPPVGWFYKDNSQKIIFLRHSPFWIWTQIKLNNSWTF